jgi:hypothetical protein
MSGSYFDSLNSWQTAAGNIQQHTQDIEQQANNAASNEIGSKFDYIDKMMQQSGGGLAGVSGGIHLTKKVMDKIKKGKKAIDDVKNAVNDVKGKVGDAVDDAKSKVGDVVDQAKGAVDDAKDAANAAKGAVQGAVDDAANAAGDAAGKMKTMGSGVGDDATAEGDDAANAAKGAVDDFSDMKTMGSGVNNDGGDTDLSNDKPPDAHSKPNGSEDDDTSTPDAGNDAPKLTGNEDSPLNEQGKFPADKIDTEDDIFSDKHPSNQAPDPNADGSNNDAKPDSKDEGDDEGEEGGDDSGDTRLGDDEGLREGDNPFGGGEQEAGDKSFGQDAYEPPAPEPQAPAPQAQPQTQTNPEDFAADDSSGVDKLGGDLVEQTNTDLGTSVGGDSANAGMKGTGEAAKSADGQVAGAGTDAGDAGEQVAGASDEAISTLAETAGKSALTTGLETVGGVMDFLGPIGEVVGGGIALGSFFHDLFDSHSEAAEEKTAAEAPTNITQGGGISTASLDTAGVKSNVIGTLT